MTKKITISIPDDVAERLAAGDVENVSAYITEAVRRRIEVEQTRDFLRARGINVTEEGVARWRAEFAERDKWLAEQRARGNDPWAGLNKRLAELRGED
jgi:hypothetical protein